MIDRAFLEDLNINEGMFRRVYQPIFRGKKRTVKPANGVISGRKQLDVVLQRAKMAQPPLGCTDALGGSPTHFQIETAGIETDKTVLFPARQPVDTGDFTDFSRRERAVKPHLEGPAEADRRDKSGTACRRLLLKALAQDPRILVGNRPPQRLLQLLRENKRNRCAIPGTVHRVRQRNVICHEGILH